MNASASISKPVTKVIEVDASLEVAFRVFTTEMRTWWQLESHHIGKAPAVDAVLEPHVGGRWYEVGDDGSECDWGKVLVWEPPTRLMLAWQISAQWQFDPNLHTEVDVRFTKLDAKRTRVDLEHRFLEAYGEHEPQMRGAFESPEGWGRILEAFASAASKH